MAFILQDLCCMNDERLIQQSKIHYQSDLGHLNFNYLQQNISVLLKKFKTMHFNVQKRQNSISIIMVHFNIIKNISLLLTIQIKKPYNNIRITSKLLNFDLNYTVVGGKQGKKVMSRYLIDRNKKQIINQCNLSIDINTGQVKAYWPIFLIQQKINQKILSSILCGILLKEENLKTFKEKVSILLTLSNQNPKYYPQDAMEKNQNRRKKVKKLFNFIQNSTTILNFVFQSSMNELQIVENSQKQEISIANIKNNKQFLNSSYSFLQLYSGIDFTKYRSKQAIEKKQALNMSPIQREAIRQAIMLPNNSNVSKSNNSVQNFFILNHIELKTKISQNCIKKIKIGGFTTIYLSEIQYWNVLSTCNQQDGQIVRYEHYEKHLPPHKKLIVIKRQTYKTQPPVRNRVAHEIKILKQIKNGFSMFLPKYYLLTEKDNLYKNDLLLDFIPFPNLATYIRQNKNILSVNTKIYIIFMICQALRYLKQYKIAHLDLKPTNIMTQKRLIIKIIDFGQAYHPSLKGNHQPGYSIPYTPPQNYKNPQTFNHKNDVFSLGIIIHELFFQKYPYYIYSDQLKRTVFLQGDFRNYWFCSPEQKLQYGQKQVVQVIYQLMTKCLKYNVQQRPQLEWLSFVLSQLNDLIY